MKDVMSERIVLQAVAQTTEDINRTHLCSIFCTRVPKHAHIARKFKYGWMRFKYVMNNKLNVREEVSLSETVSGCSDEAVGK